MGNELTLVVDRQVMEACHAMASHVAINKIVGEPEVLGDGSVRVVAEFEVPLPSRLIAQGESRFGVKARERVIFDFPQAFPLKAPKIKLRTDFPLHFPHINPYRKGEYVNPCVYYGSLDELLQQPNGFNEIINHTADWLEKAARNDLTNPDQGWEPIRRDGVNKFHVFALDEFQEKILDGPGHSEFSVTYFQQNSFFIGKCSSHLDRQASDERIKEIYATNGKGEGWRDYLGLLIWPGRDAVADTYFPEKVTKLKELRELAEGFGCKALSYRLSALSRFLYKNGKDYVFNLVVVLCARRPYNVIGTDSNLELIPYLLELRLQKTGLQELWDENSRVFPVEHRHEVSPELFRKTSGAEPPNHSGGIVQLGCGSLGSKIAIHLARAGHGPFRLFDKHILSPHNFARHGLFNTLDNFCKNKAVALSAAIQSFRQVAEPCPVDIVEYIHSRKTKKYIFPKSTTLIVDSSASLSVREALAAIPREMLPGRIMQTGLYASGNVGIMAIEGHNRSPRMDDLAVKLFDRCIDDAALRNFLKPSDESFSRHPIGQGCGSHTMVMSDSCVSLYAASMAENARKILETSDAVAGLWIGVKCGLGVEWEHHELGESILAQPCDGQSWEIRILSTAAENMKIEVERHSPQETGGILIGKIFENRKTVIISRILSPPPDSVRTSTEFVLGTVGLKKEVERVQNATGKTLCYLGTWHSHPQGGGPSEKDRRTLKRMVELRLGFPTINLIWTPTGYVALMDEGVFFSG